MKQIPLGRGLFALVDSGDYEEISRFNWRAQFDRHTGSYYAHRNQRINGKRYDFKMARQILGLEFGDSRIGEHSNQNTLDNRRFNLRIATVAQNNQNRRIPKNNTSGAKGLVFHRSRNRWEVRIQTNKIRKSYGTFDTKEEAILRRNQVASEVHGEFARNY